MLLTTNAEFNFSKTQDPDDVITFQEVFNTSTTTTITIPFVEEEGQIDDDQVTLTIPAGAVQTPNETEISMLKVKIYPTTVVTNMTTGETVIAPIIDISLPGI